MPQKIDDFGKLITDFSFAIAMKAGLAIQGQNPKKERKLIAELTDKIMAMYIDAVKSPPSQNGWIDIASAPKDGRWILVTWLEEGKYSQAVVSWTKNAGHGFIGAEWKQWDDWELSASGGYAEDSLLYASPTHWQPLPQPPIKGE